MKKKFYHWIHQERERRVAVEHELSLRLRQQETIAWLGEYALRCEDLDSFFKEVVQKVSETLEMEYCKVLELLPDGKDLLLKSGVGWKEGLEGHATVGSGADSQAGYTLLTEEPVIVDDLRSETRFSGPQLLIDHQVISGMSVIIPGREKPYGVLGVHSAQPKKFLPHDTRFIKAISSILASAIEHFRTQGELQRSRDELSIILNGVSEGVTVQDRMGKMVFVNQSAVEILGYSSVQEVLAASMDEVRGKFTLLDEDGSPFPMEQMPSRLVFQGVPKPSARIRFRINATGEENWSIVDATPIKDADGNVVQSVNIFRNVTDLVLSEQYQKFLSEAGVLLASTLDYKTTLSNLANLAVTNLADWCTVHLVGDTEGAYQLTVAHKDPSRLELAREYQHRFPPDWNAKTGLANVLRTGKLEFYPLLTDELLAATARSPEHLEMVRTLGLRSVIIAPLVARGRILGAITLIWAESGRVAGQRDVQLVTELAHRAAIAIDNARLYQEAQALNHDLEQRVHKRTEQLQRMNRKLGEEIEERRRTESALKKSETLANSLFESAPDAVILLDLDGKIVRVNQQAENLFGYAAAELVGETIERLLPARYRARHKRNRTNYSLEMRMRAMGAGVESVGLAKDQREIPVDIMLSPVQTDEGDLVICAIRNISEQKKMQAELSETHRRLFESIEAERLAISQELHDGPIQELYGTAIYLETLKHVLTLPEDLEDLQEEKEHVQSIVQALRSVCGELRPPTLTHFGLEKALRSHLFKIREAHPELQITAQIMSDGTRLSERTRLALYRVYQNSIANIIRHAEARSVDIDFRITENEISFTIQDDGRGFAVPERWVDLIREGHFGLVGMIERVEAIGGQLLVESQIGSGTKIHVTVPLESGIMTAAAQSS